MSGSNGTIISYQNGVFTPLTTSSSSDVVVFGMWGATARR